MAKSDTREIPAVPEGRRPEEFMNDEQLAAYHEQLADDSPEGRKALQRAKIAAAITASVDPDAAP